MIHFKTPLLLLGRSFGYKLNYISGEMAKAINQKRRGGKRNRRPPEEVFDLLFNDYDQNPQGEFSELRFELEHKTGLANYAGDLADLLWNVLRFKGSGIDARLKPVVFGIGREIGFTKTNIADACIIKYHSRHVYGKRPDIESKVLGTYFKNLRGPTEAQVREAIRRIDAVRENKELYRP